MQKIPDFPVFNKLELGVYKEYSDIICKFEPYSDFNFISLFSWNTDGSVGVSKLNDNLVIRLPDYISGEPNLSLLGRNKINESVKILLSIVPIIKLVPEEVALCLVNTDTLLLVEDTANHDYIYDLKNLSSLEGRTFKWKRKRLRRLEREYWRSLSFENSTQDLISWKERVTTIFNKWSEQNGKNAEEADAERIALENIIELSKFMKNLKLTILSYDGRDIGFSINEIGVPCSTCHFQKSLNDIENIDILLTNYTAKLLLAKKSNFINWEQDLGIEGLRRFKQSYHPIRLLKKYSISNFE